MTILRVNFWVKMGSRSTCMLFQLRLLMLLKKRKYSVRRLYCLQRVRMLPSKRYRKSSYCQLLGQRCVLMLFTVTAYIIYTVKFCSQMAIIQLWIKFTKCYYRALDKRLNGSRYFLSSDLANTIIIVSALLTYSFVCIISYSLDWDHRLTDCCCLDRQAMERPC